MSLSFSTNFQPEKPLAYLLDKYRLYNEPYGVVLVLGTWNYPLHTIIPVIAAIAAGNCVIIKPSEVARASAKFIADTLPKYIDNVSHDEVFYYNESSQLY